MSMRWTDEARAKQAERIRKSKPWLKSTGPKTEQGKRISCMNALKSGAYAAEMRDLEILLLEISRAVGHND
ncbi:hypothetical protein HH196_10385 [Marinobacterium sp. LSUCC0821]|nr:hypothetical protein HH196_10385 [Marinobacterium sp. LSUCC0821]